MPLTRHTSRWFQIAAAGGVLLAILLLVEAASTYRDAGSRLERDQGLLQAAEEVSSLERELGRQQTDTRDGLKRVLSQITADRSDEIAWMSVMDADGRAQASSGAVETHPAPPEGLRAALERSGVYSTVQDTARGRILIALLPIKRAFLQHRLPANWTVLEVAIYLRGPEGILHPLRRNLLISVAAAIALLVFMIVFLLRLPAYVRGRELQNQLQLARSVQQKLLPSAAGGDAVEFAGECLPAGEVGGDSYDVFLTDAGEIALVLADVSGKGLPAALRMGVVHGAVRALSLEKRDVSVASMAARLNQQLREESSGEFVTLFWAFYNPQRHELRYVNAGHLPPLLVASASGEPRRLDQGGPVIGLLPNASYQEECISLNGDETLITCSDGLLEAMNPEGEEFGESRLLSIVRASLAQSARRMVRRVIEEAERFIEGGHFDDDLTVLVAKLNPKI